jgi:hypothetical protein
VLDLETIPLTFYVSEAHVPTLSVRSTVIEYVRGITTHTDRPAQLVYGIVCTGLRHTLGGSGCTCVSDDNEKDSN